MKIMKQEQLKTKDIEGNIDFIKKLGEVLQTAADEDNIK